MQRNKRATIRDVARKCGFSTVTVSRVIANNPGVRPETRQAVLDAMRALNYSNAPDLGGASPPRYIAVLIDDLLDHRHFRIAANITDALLQYDYLALICYCNANTIWKYLEMYPHQVAGFIAVSLLGAQAEALSETGAKGIPLIAVHRCPAFTSAHSIVNDDYSNAMMAVEHLATLGHRNMILINHAVELAGTYEATMGYHTAIRNLGLVARQEYIINSTSHPDFGKDIFYHIRQRHPEVTAVICASGAVAHAIYSCCVTERMSVPGDMSIVTFDIESSPGTRQMTAVGVNHSKIAEVAVDTIQRFINDPDSNGTDPPAFSKTILKSELQIGFSTGRPHLPAPENA